ncbi:NTP transferase domain-containing protein [Candidatus Dojkabacteria bacterium]|uniref:NTP transferase domain-containing protein n=1 Tax=Candidatus Dojkabacteria bacterium TaxID=2099670 RepID=A0A955L9S1_9BACT|nr:NTP transferase domain-containing protein [Candidatus Dojkabacteria bacterium]
MNLLLLAGGSSSRFYPLKEKNTYEFLGVSVVEYQLKRYINFLQPNKVVIIVNAKIEEEIKELVQNSNISADVVVQEGDGMAGAAQTGLSYLDPEDELIVANMNDFFDDSLFAKFLELKSSGSKRNLVTGLKTKTYFPGGYLVLDDESNVIGVEEKPGEGNEHSSEYVRFVFDYFMKAGDFSRALDEASSNKDDVYEVAQSILMAEKAFELLEYQQEWRSIKYPWHVLEVMELFLSKLEGETIADNVQIAENVTIKGDVIIESGVKIFEGAVIRGPAYIGKNTIIGNGALVRNSMIGNNSVVGFATEVSRSYVGNDTWFHKNYIGDSIIEHNVSFGSNAVTANLRLDEDEIYAMVKGEKIPTGTTKLGTIVGSNTRIGVGAMIMPGVKIGSDSVVGPMVVVQKDISAGVFLKTVQETVERENKISITDKNRDEYSSKL